jgi:hypothetical protein
MSYRNYPFDESLLLKASAAVTSSAAGSLILDVGDALCEGEVIVDASAFDIVSNDEQYDIVLQGSPDAAFGTAGNIVELGSITIGCKEAKRTDGDADDAVGRFIFPVRNERNATVFRYLRIYTVVAGTSPSITYKAWLSKVRS